MLGNMVVCMKKKLYRKFYPRKYPTFVRNTYPSRDRGEVFWECAHIDNNLKKKGLGIFSWLSFVLGISKSQNN